MIIISPYSSKLRDGRPSPKDYPYWKEVVAMLQLEYNLPIIQVGIKGEQQISNVKIFIQNLPMQKLRDLVLKSTFFISVDNFLPHFAHYYQKSGVVLWSYSNPILFGYPENLNLYTSEKYFKEKQFESWDYPLLPYPKYLTAGDIIKKIREKYK